MRDSNEHALSYYAATRNYSTDYPTLRGEQRADVVMAKNPLSKQHKEILLRPR
jgi:hypothetical protein